MFSVNFKGLVFFNRFQIVVNFVFTNHNVKLKLFIEVSKRYKYLFTRQGSIDFNSL